MSGDLIGRQLGKYLILEVVDQGGMATVYKAEDTVLGRSVAVKVLAPALAASADSRQRFLHEARAAANLRHPNLVTIYDVGDADGLPFIVMEFLQGRPLSDTIMLEGPLRPSRAAHLVRQIADALDYAHARGVIHRDVKPSNVIVDAQDRATLTDFGIARSREGSDLTRTGVPLGTPAYMAPEQIKGEEVGPAADLYALGVLAYEMLAGRKPFKGDTPTVLHAHVYEAPPPIRRLNPDVPASAASVLEKALAKNPAGRWADGATFAEALERAVTSTRPDLRAEAATTARVEWARPDGGRRQPWYLLAAAAVLLALAALVVRAGLFLPGQLPASATSATRLLDDAALATPTLSQSPAAAVIASFTPLQVAAVSPTPTPATPTSIPATSTATPSATATRRPARTATPRPPRPSATSAPQAAATAAPTPTPTATDIDAPTRTDTGGPTPAPTDTGGPTPAPTGTGGPVPVPSDTRGPMPTPTCVVAVDADLAATWNRDRLGCATARSTITWAAWQTFEHGYLFWRKDVDKIYVLYAEDAAISSGTWLRGPDEWTWDGSNPEGVGLVPPQGLYEPKRGFGWVWRIYLGSAGGRLGWAREEEKGFCARLQPFERGIMLGSSVVIDCGTEPVDPGFASAYAAFRVTLFEDGTWRRY